MAFLAALPSIPCFQVWARSFSGTRDSQPAIKLGKLEYFLIASSYTESKGGIQVCF